MTNKKTQITVLAVGNPILQDDGTGQALLAELQGTQDDSWMPHSANRPAEQAHRPHQDAMASAVEFIDGGISGMELLPIIQDSTHILLLDAIAGPTPGEVVVLEGDQLPRLRRAKLSPHQVGLMDLLSAARLLGCEPEHVAAVGIVPEQLDPGVGLSDTVRRSIPTAAHHAADILSRWLGPQ